MSVRALAASVCLAGLSVAAVAHTGNFVIFRTIDNRLGINYSWSFPTFLDEEIPPYRGDALNVFIEPKVIPNVALNEYAPLQGSQIYLEVIDAMPKIVYRDGQNLSRIIGTGPDAYYCGEGGTAWNGFVWIQADQFHPAFNWTPPPPFFDWWVDVRAYDATNMQTPSPVYRMRIAVENFCPADFTHTAIPGEFGYGVPDQIVNNDDFFVFLTLFASQSWRADLTSTAVQGAPGFGDQDFQVTNDDFFYYLVEFINGCRQ